MASNLFASLSRTSPLPRARVKRLITPKRLETAKNTNTFARIGKPSYVKLSGLNRLWSNPANSGLIYILHPDFRVLGTEAEIIAAAKEMQYNDATINTILQNGIGAQNAAANVAAIEAEVRDEQNNPRRRTGAKTSQNVTPYNLDELILLYNTIRKRNSPYKINVKTSTGATVGGGSKSKTFEDYWAEIIDANGRVVGAIDVTNMDIATGKGVTKIRATPVSEVTNTKSGLRVGSLGLGIFSRDINKLNAALDRIAATGSVDAQTIANEKARLANYFNQQQRSTFVNLRPVGTVQGSRL